MSPVEDPGAAAQIELADREPAQGAPETAGSITPGRPEGAPRLEARRPETRTYAALDLGTNNCRLLVARPSSEGFRVVDAFSRIVRLGEGLGGSRRLNDGAIGRTIEALKVFLDRGNFGLGEDLAESGHRQLVIDGLPHNATGKILKHQLPRT